MNKIVSETFLLLYVWSNLQNYDLNKYAILCKIFITHHNINIFGNAENKIA